MMASASEPATTSGALSVTPTFVIPHDADSSGATRKAPAGVPAILLGPASGPAPTGIVAPWQPLPAGTASQQLAWQVELSAQQWQLSQQQRAHHQQQEWQLLSTATDTAAVNCIGAVAWRPHC